MTTFYNYIVKINYTYIVLCYKKIISDMVRQVTLI